MSYCVNCGVELDGSLQECPLCETPVINPNAVPFDKVSSPFPKNVGMVEEVKRQDLAILVTVALCSIAATCGLLNALVFEGYLWSLAIIGACVLLWVILIPVLIYRKQSIYISLFYNGCATVLYLYLLTYLVGSDTWFIGLGLPIVVFVTMVCELWAVCYMKLPKSFLTNALYFFTGVGILCGGLEVLIDNYLAGPISIDWSAIVVTVCIIVDIIIITTLSMKRLRNAVRKRLHF